MPGAKAMNKLNAEWCAYLLKDLQRQSITGCGISMKEERYMQALEIALPILEQQERGEGEWIEWGGKGKPAEATPKMIEVKLRDGDTAIEVASLWRWSHYGDETDIIAYRIIPERANNQNGEDS